MNLRHVLSKRATEVTVGVDRLDDARLEEVRRISAELGKLSERVVTAQKSLKGASLHAGRHERVNGLRGLIKRMMHDVERQRGRLDIACVDARNRTRYLVADMVRGAARRRAALVSIERSALRRRASAVRDTVATTIDNLASTRSALLQLFPAGLKAQAAFVSTVARAENGVRQIHGVRKIRSKGPVTAPSAPASSPGSHREHIDLPAFDRAVRALPIVAGSALANFLSDLRTAMREGRVALYRGDPGIRIETDDKSVRDILARLQANPRGTAMLLRIAAPPNAGEQNDPDQAIAPSPTAVPSLSPNRPVSQPTFSQLPLEPLQPHEPPSAEPERDVAGAARRDGNER